MLVGHSERQRFSCVHVSDNGLKGIIYAQTSYKSAVHILRYRGNDQKALLKRSGSGGICPTIGGKVALKFLSIAAFRIGKHRPHKLDAAIGIGGDLFSHPLLQSRFQC